MTAPCYSGDFDIFHDREDRVARAALEDGAVLRADGFALQWLRREPRDVADLVTINDRILPLGAVAWAAVGKSRGFTPEGLINKVRRLAHYTEADLRCLANDPPIDPVSTMTRFRQVLDEADPFVARMPSDKVGRLSLEAGHAVQRDPDRLQTYQTHAGQRRGQSPTSPSISAAMLERYTGNAER